MLEMPVLETTRLYIRPFIMADLRETHRLFDVELQDANMGAEKMETLQDARHGCSGQC